MFPLYILAANIFEEIETKMKQTLVQKVARRDCFDFLETNIIQPQTPNYIPSRAKFQWKLGLKPMETVNANERDGPQAAGINPSCSQYKPKCY